MDVRYWVKSYSFFFILELNDISILSKKIKIKIKHLEPVSDQIPKLDLSPLIETKSSPLIGTGSGKEQFLSQNLNLLHKTIPVPGLVWFRLRTNPFTSCENLI